MSYNDKYLDAAVFKGKTFVTIEQKDNDLIIFTTDTGEVYEMYHPQDCCESVSIYDVKGEYSSILNSPLIIAEQDINSDNAPKEVSEWDSFTWTIYKFGTETNTVVIRWLGISNGYYSESVDIVRVK